MNDWGSLTDSTMKPAVRSHLLCAPLPSPSLIPFHLTQLCCKVTKELFCRGRVLLATYPDLTKPSGRANPDSLLGAICQGGFYLTYLPSTSPSFARWLGLGGSPIGRCYRSGTTAPKYETRITVCVHVYITAQKGCKICPNCKDRDMYDVATLNNQHLSEPN